MTPIFGFGRTQGDSKSTTKPNPPRRKVTRDPDKELERKLKRFRTETFIDMAKDSESIKRQMVEKEHNITVEDDAAAQRRKKIDDTLTERAITELESDEDYAKRLARHRLEKELGIDLGESGDDNAEDYESEGDPFENYRRTKDFIEEQGGGRGILGGLIDSSVVRTIFEMLPSILNRGGGGQPQVLRRWVVETPEGMKELDTESYQKYLEARMVPHLKASEAIAEQPEPVTAEEQAEEKGSPRILNMAKWSYLLGEDPSNFVETLIGEAKDEDEDAILMLAILRDRSSTQVMQLIQPVREMELEDDIKECFERVTEEWIVEVQGILAKQSDSDSEVRE